MTASLGNRAFGMALAVHLSDDFTERTAAGPIEVSGCGRAAFRNPSGYYVFSRLPTGTATIAVAPAYYLPEQLSATIPAPDPLLPLVEQTLLPSWLYPFPAGSTWVAARVISSTGEPVASAAVEGVGRPTRTSRDGRFVAYFRALSEDEVVVDADRRLVLAPDSTTTFGLTVSHPEFDSTTVSVSEIEEGNGRYLDTVVLTPI